jgi:glycosyltransferase involved in cell wall biosynthesis
MLTPQPPYPPRQGTALRNWGLLRGLAAHHAVSLLTFAARDRSPVPDPTLARTVERVALVEHPTRTLRDRLRDLVTKRTPDLTERLASAAFERQLTAWLEAHTFDWLIVEGLEMAPYLEILRAVTTTKGGGPRVLFDAHNCEYLLQRRAAQSDRRRPRRWPGAAYSAVQWRRLRRYEAAVCRRADLVVAVSEADARALRAIAPGVDPLVIPNGIDVAAYAGFEKAADLKQPAFVFTGTMDFRPNVDGVLWFVDAIWPTIREALPGAHLYLVGRRPHARLDRVRDLPGVVITGGVPDTRPYIRAATVYVVPLLVGGGTRLKILESTAMSKAIVATSLGAEGFVAPERAMVLADEPEGFAEACIALARDAEARAQWGARAHAFAEGYDWDTLLPPLLARLAQKGFLAQ